MTSVGPESTSVGPESILYGPDSGGPAGLRGTFMGYTIPGSGLTTGLCNIAQNQSHVGWLRCGDPEISNASMTGSVLSTTFLASVASQVALANSHGLGLVFSVLGVPTSVNASAGTGGNWKYWPTNHAGDVTMANCCAQIATVLMDSTRSTGIQNAITYLQEPNISQFNPGAQSAARWAAAQVEYINAVRAAEPDIIIYSGDLANRGDYKNPVPSDVGWTGPAFITAAMTAGTGFGITACPDYYGYHPYVYPTSPSNTTAGWGMAQMDAYAFALASNGATDPAGNGPKVSVTEYGAPYTGTGYSPTTQKQALQDYIAAFDARRAAGWLAGPELYYTLASGDPKALYIGTAPTLAGQYYELLAMTGAPVGPTATFTSSIAALVVTFTDTSVGSPTSWAWTFGDGGTSSSQNPSHTYAASGTYTVVLTVTDTNGVSDSQTHTVTVTTGFAASFTAVPQAGAAPLLVTFTDTTTGSPTSWAWTFGDGGTSTSQNPTHTYSSVGTYTATLAATKSGVTVTATKTITVTATGAVPGASFLYVGPDFHAPATISFVDLSTNGPTSWSWNFGNGDTSTSQNPVYTYSTPGSYVVTLIATNGSGSSAPSTQFIVIIPVSVPPPVPLVKIKLELGVRPGSKGDLGHWFCLGTSTLGGPDALAPDWTYFDLDGYWLSIGWDQGYDQEAGDIRPATIDADLENRSRIFDKANTLSPFFPKLSPPAVRMRLTVDDVVLGTFVIDELNPQYSIDESPAPISGSDGLSALARTPLRFHAIHQITRFRLHRILDHAGWRDGRFIPDGFFTLGNYEIDTKALDEINAIAKAEDTLIYCNADNTFVFVPRASLTGDPVFTFSDDGTGDADYLTIHYSDGNATFANAVRVTRRGNGTQTDKPVPQGYVDWDSVNDYTNGIPVELDITDSPVDTDGAALIQAGMIGSRYARPLDHIDGLTLDLTDFDAATRQKLLALTVGTIVLVLHTPNQTGAQNEQTSIVIGRSLSINADRTRIEMTFRFRPEPGGI